MKRLAIWLLSASVTTPVLAQHQGHGEQESPPHEQHGTADPHAGHGQVHAADALFGPREMAAAREQLRAEHGGVEASMFLADRFETRFGDGEEQYLWDVQGWYGGDINRLWIKSEGEGSLGDNLESAEVQVLYSRAFTPFFDVQTGLRYDVRPEPDRAHLVLGIQGLLPYLFEVDAAAFVSEEGDLTGRLEGEYDLQIDQRLILQPRIELNFAAQEVPELRIGSGVGSIEAGVRLRYEIRREFAPYVGIGWERKLGGTADLARAAGEDRGGWEAVAGVRVWF